MAASRSVLLWRKQQRIKKDLQEIRRKAFRVRVRTLTKWAFRLALLCSLGLVYYSTQLKLHRHWEHRSSDDDLLSNLDTQIVLLKDATRRALGEILVSFESKPKNDVMSTSGVKNRDEVQIDEEEDLLHLKPEFVHITSTGGMSVVATGAAMGLTWGICHFEHHNEFGEGCAKPDWGWPKAPSFSKEVLSSGFNGELWHTPPHWLDPNPYRGLPTFTIVRNPYDRIISEYYSLTEGAHREKFHEEHRNVQKGQSRHAREAVMKETRDGLEWRASKMREQQEDFSRSHTPPQVAEGGKSNELGQKYKAEYTMRKSSKTETDSDLFLSQQTNGESDDHEHAEGTHQSVQLTELEAPGSNTFRHNNDHSQKLRGTREKDMIEKDSTLDYPDEEEDIKSITKKASDESFLENPSSQLPENFATHNRMARDSAEATAHALSKQDYVHNAYDVHSNSQNTLHHLGDILDHKKYQGVEEEEEEAEATMNDRIEQFEPSLHQYGDSKEYGDVQDKTTLSQLGNILDHKGFDSNIHNHRRLMGITSFFSSAPSRDSPRALNTWIQKTLKGRSLSTAHRLPQHLYVYDLKHGATKLVDHILHFENLNEEFENLMLKEFDIPAKLPVNATNQGHYHSENKPRMTVEELDHDSIRLINDIYRLDFELLGYDLRTPPPKKGFFSF